MVKDCRDTALSYLEHRQRSACEMKTHLTSKGFSEEEIEEEICWLKELHYLDDARYCGDYIRYAVGKGRGPVRLQLELKQKGIDPALIKESLDECFDRQTEAEAAMREAKKLLKGLDDMRPDEKTLAKIGRKLNSLGYHTDLIYDVIRKVGRT